MGPDGLIFIFWMLGFKPTFSLSSFTFIKRLFSSSWLSAIRVVSFAYLRLLIFLLAALIPACVSSSLVFRKIYSAHRLNKQVTIYGLDILLFQFCTNSFHIWLYLLLSWSAYRFLRRQVRLIWYSHLLKNFPLFVVIHTIKGFSIANEAEVYVFLEFLCFFSDPADIGNLISGSSAFSKSSLYIWKFLVHVLLKPSLKDFENYFASMWNECNCAVVWTFFGIALWDWNEIQYIYLFQSCGHCWVFQICWHIECISLTASSFRVWNSSTGIPSHPLTLFRVMLPKAHLTSHSRMSGSRWVTTPLWLSESLRPFLYSSSCHLFLISSASVRSVPFLSFIVPIFAWNIPLVLLLQFCWRDL